ncbi:MAG TPA: biotin carboxylase N-terminal domain-containing protein [Novosphingobium sp.]|nr:biotin carboxylase N-terminal domain-containing protein [Novosphingobium sp.]
MIRKLLIANRGEIAIRIARTCRRLGISVASVHSVADRDALHVREIGESYEIGESAPSSSYLNIAAILDAARSAGADAIHPGIGFLAESPEFAAAVEEAGFVFVGPRPQSLADFGDKATSKVFAIAAGVPIIQGTEEPSSDTPFLAARAKEMELPLMLKAVAGGGGRGSRIVHSHDGIADAIQSAMREAQSAFGRPDLIIETFIASARHVEVQVVGDGNGHVLHLFERECSLQRRFQKIIEEAPAQHLKPELREAITADAVRLAASVNYRSAGTFEFLVSGDRYYFLECNPRLQVEHTVTEEITGVDIVELQLRVAANGALPIDQSAVAMHGHAVQARLYAEDPAHEFLPSTGHVRVFVPPRGNVRVETGIESGSEITPHYDSLLAKIIVRADNRVAALAQLRNAIMDTTVLGVETNLGLLAALCADPCVIADDVDNRYIDRQLPGMFLGQAPEPFLAAVAGAIDFRAGLAAPDGGTWKSPEFTSWRMSDGADELSTDWLGATLFESRGHKYRMHRHALGKDRFAISVGEATFVIDLSEVEPGRFSARSGSRTILCRASVAGDAVFLAAASGAYKFLTANLLDGNGAGTASDGRVMSDMMGVVIKVNVKPGDEIELGDVIMLQESMKMELTIAAPCAGTVKAVHCGAGDMIERNVLVVEIEPRAVEDSE